MYWHAREPHRMDVSEDCPSVLIAEDEILIREALRQELDKRYKVVAAVGDGQAAVETVEKARPDVALLDISMPVMNGLDAARQIVEAAPQVKIIFFTSHANQPTSKKLFAGVQAAMS
jgi:CheY-like chemotaxis protein